MKVAILSIYNFPNGGAATNRIIAYSKSLIENNIDVDVFIPLPTENINGGANLDNDGVFQEIRYKFTSGIYRSRYKIIRGFLILTKLRLLFGFVTSFFSIIRANKHRDYSAIIISTDMLLALYVYGLLAKKIEAKSIFIFDEFPIPIRHKLKNKIPLWKKVGYKTVLGKMDGYISISNKLKEYFNDFVDKPTFVLPIIVDSIRFKIRQDNDFKKQYNLPLEYLCYMGNMELAKDNIVLIIRAFHNVHSKYDNLFLLLFGAPKKNDLLIVNKLIHELGLEDKVILKGRIPSAIVPKVLMNAKILVSSQPDTKRASGGFPTKLAEYLLAGKPTILTDVGENSKYVKDGKHCFFVPPDDIESYYRKIEFVLDNYEKCLNISGQGKAYILKNYSLKETGKKLSLFLKDL